MGDGGGGRHGNGVVVAAGDELAAHLLATVLDHEGWDVLEASDLADLRRVAQQPGVIAVVLDTRLPDAPGPTEALRSLRTDPDTAALTLVLFGRSPTDVVAGAAAGADAVLTAPFAPLDLLEVLADLLGPAGGGAVSA